MMYAKALLFGDGQAAERILAAETPREHQAIGREVRGFDEAVWGLFREGIVFAGNYARFSQNLDQREMLFSTCGTTLVEASPHDRVWGIVLRLDGYAHLGKEFDIKLRAETKSRGSELRLLGSVHYDRKKQAIVRFDAVGVGQAWGRRTNEIRLDSYPWMYGIACELVTGGAPHDLIPPYNMLHYNPTGPYFGR